MNDLFTSFLKSVVDRAVAALGVALLTHGWLTASQSSLYEQVASGGAMIIVGALIGWYRDHGKALLKAEIDRLNAKVDGLTKQIEQGPKLDGKAVAQAAAVNIAKK